MKDSMRIIVSYMEGRVCGIVYTTVLGLSWRNCRDRRKYPVIIFSLVTGNLIRNLPDTSYITTILGRAVAQAVRRRLPTAAARVRAQVMWDLWWTKWHWGRFSPSISLSPANSLSTDCSTFIIIYHPGLVQ
jgi:hypothetical protein